MARRLVAPTAALALGLGLAGCPGDASTQPTPPPASPSPTGGDAASADTPTPAPSPFDRDSLETRWADAEVGDWASYKIHVPREMNFRFEVTEVGERTVTVKQTDLDSGEVRQTREVDLAEEEERLQDPRELGGMTEDPKTETMDFGGEPLEVLVIKRKGAGSTIESWLTEAGPPPFMDSVGWTIVKSLKDGSLNYELLEFGSAE